MVPSYRPGSHVSTVFKAQKVGAEVLLEEKVGGGRDEKQSSVESQPAVQPPPHPEAAAVYVHVARARSYEIRACATRAGARDLGPDAYVDVDAGYRCRC